MRGLQVVGLVLLLLLIPVFGAGGCAGKKLDTVITLVPLINDEFKAVSDALEVQKPNLQLATCGTYPADYPDKILAGGPMDCYVRFTGILAEADKYKVVFQESAKALNTTSALQAIRDMSGVIQNAINREVLKLPDKVRLFLLVALEALRSGLAAAEVSLSAGGTVASDAALQVAQTIPLASRLMLAEMRR